MQKRRCNNPNLDNVNINAYINLVKLCQFVLKILSSNEMTSTNPNLDFVNMNAYIKFGETLSICSHNIERK